ncbi:hypothetical protein GCM10008023_38450 [Sphingomonas glacialis]|uniref:Uncharacterized protein n=1 Tax=Sphingomonas glacialis TaxID=658225 RepID=A0ABQ3LTA6_9SPHN|nr:hypothetical protein GCM10008023_38450 [Sphingomonas glacialis]
MIRHPGRFTALLSIEGNLTSEDAYFSGQATGFADPDAFKRVFVTSIRDMATRDPAMGRYATAVAGADALAMWRLGRDAAELGRDDGFGAE